MLVVIAIIAILAALLLPSLHLARGTANAVVCQGNQRQIGMALSIIGMFFAAAGYLPPVAGAIAQEGIDVFAVLNALRVNLPVRSLTDYE